jgi:F-type H+-transporting ATPase subunit b
MKRFAFPLAVASLVATPFVAEAASGIPLATEWTMERDFPRIVNSLLILVGVLYLLKRFAAPALAHRAAAIAERRVGLEKAKADAEAKLAVYKAKLAEMEQEAERIKADARAEGEILKNKIVADARAQAEAVVVRAAAQIEMETDRARDRLRRETSLAAIEMAEEIIKKSFGPDDQKRLVDGYLSHLESMN